VKIVAVSQRIDDYPDRNERRDALDQKLSCFLMECGFVSLPVPNGLSKKREGSEGAFNGLGSWLQIFNKPSAVLLSGGNEVGSCIDRDCTEKGLIDFASMRSLPVLGICRGKQLS
jgi:hypothetical protein